MMMMMVVDSDQMGVVLWQLKSWIDNNFYAHFPVEVRFAKQDERALLGLSRHYDVCYINIIMYRYTHSLRQVLQVLLLSYVCYINIIIYRYANNNN